MAEHARSDVKVKVDAFPLALAPFWPTCIVVLPLLAIDVDYSFGASILCVFTGSGVSEGDHPIRQSTFTVFESRPLHPPNAEEQARRDVEEQARQQTTTKVHHALSLACRVHAHRAA